MTNLSEFERETLYGIAARVVESAGHSTGKPDISPPDIESLKRQQGSFVTLYRAGNLRGCIGDMSYTKELWKSVYDSAWLSATKDTRFLPITESELDELTIEISVLSPIERIPGYESFIPGKQGIVIERDGNRAVFLPKVAAEQGWTREETLDNLCIKAGLHKKSWQKPGSEFSVFYADVFGKP